jgi:hypothetical protein
MNRKGKKKKKKTQEMIVQLLIFIASHRPHDKGPKDGPLLVYVLVHIDSIVTVKGYRIQQKEKQNPALSMLEGLF